MTVSSVSAAADGGNASPIAVNAYLQHLTLCGDLVSLLSFARSYGSIKKWSYHGIDQLDAIVFRGVMTGGDHHAHRLSPQLP
jgi:hypothetical protein